LDTITPADGVGSGSSPDGRTSAKKIRLLKRIFLIHSIFRLYMGNISKNLDGNKRV